MHRHPLYLLWSLFVLPRDVVSRWELYQPKLSSLVSFLALSCPHNTFRLPAFQTIKSNEEVRFSYVVLSEEGGMEGL